MLAKNIIFRELTFALFFQSVLSGASWWTAEPRAFDATASLLSDGKMANLLVAMFVCACMYTWTRYTRKPVQLPRTTNELALPWSHCDDEERQPFRSLRFWRLASEPSNILGIDKRFFVPMRRNEIRKPEPGEKKEKKKRRYVRTTISTRDGPTLRVSLFPVDIYLRVPSAGWRALAASL